MVFEFLKNIFLFFLFLGFACNALSQGRIGLAWDASPDTNVVGYAIYYGTNSGAYLSRHEVGNKLSTIVTNLNISFIYYFVATAYTAEGIESLPSNEVFGYPSTNNIVILTIPSSLRIEKR